MRCLRFACLILTAMGLAMPVAATAAAPVPQRAFSCFKNSQKEALVLRVEWTAAKRYAILSWPAGTTLKVHVGGGSEEIRWCWGAKLEEVTAGCPAAKRQWVVRNNCG